MRRLLLLSLLVLSAFITSAQEPRKDTVKVLMLVCDTNFTQKELFFILPNPDSDLYILNKVWWQVGYEVYERKQSVLPTGFGEKKLVERLSTSMKPLSKDIIVWIIKYLE